MAPSSRPIGSFQVVSNFVGTTEQKTDGATRYVLHPVRIAVPVAEGKLRADDALVVRDPDGKAVPAIVRPSLAWPDGSVRIAEVWLPLNLRQGERLFFTLTRGAPAAIALPDAHLT